MSISHDMFWIYRTSEEVCTMFAINVFSHGFVSVDITQCPFINRD